MTDEERAFQNFLDEHPDNHTARMVFADWLDDQGDPRGPGYRALGVNQVRMYPMEANTKASRFLVWNVAKYPGYLPATANCPEPKWNYGQSMLWRDWFLAIGVGDLSFCARNTNCELMDVLALAFSRLSEARQTELLTPASPPAPVSG